MITRRIPIERTQALVNTDQRIGVLENRLGPVEAQMSRFDAVASEAGTRSLVADAAATITLAGTPTAIMAQLAPFAGRRVLVRPNPLTTDGSYRVDNLTDPQEIVLPAGTTLEAQGDFWIGFRNPVRGGFLLTNPRCGVIAKLRGDYGSDALHSVNQEWTAGEAEWIAWAAAWNAANTPTVPLNASLTFRASWTASYAQTFAKWFGLAASGRNSLVTIANANGQTVHLTVMRTPIGVLAVGGPGITQTTGHDIKVVIEGDDFIFGVLTKRIDSTRIETFSTGTGNGRGANPQHVVYSANEPTIGEESTNLDIIVNASGYRDAEVVKLKRTRKSRLWLTCTTVASACTIGEESDLLIKQFTVRDMGLDAISDALSPALPVGLRVLGNSRVSADCVIDIQQRASTVERSQDTLVCIQLKDAVVNFPLGWDIKVSRLTPGRSLVSMFGVQDSVFGPSRFFDAGNAQSRIYSLAADGDGESCDRNAFGPVTTTGTNRIAILDGRSTDNSFLIDEAQLDGGYAEGSTFINNGFGRDNRVSLLGGSVRYLAAATAPELMTRATASFKLIEVPTFDSDGNSTFDYANVAAGDTLTIGGVTYTFVATVGELTVANRVLVGASGALSLRYLARAINATTTGSEGPGLTYGTGTVAHPTVTALSTGAELDVRAIALAGAGDGITVSAVCATGAWEGATLTGGGKSDTARLFRYYGVAPGASNVPVNLPPSSGAGVRAGDSVTLAKTDTAAGAVEVRDGVGGTVVGTLRREGDAATFQYVGGKWQQQTPTRTDSLNGVTMVRVTSDVVISSAGLTTFLTLAGLKLDTAYRIDGSFIFRSSATTNGVGFSLGFSDSVPTSFAATWSINTSQSGTVAPSISTQRASNTVANTATVDTANADMLATVTGLCVSSLAGATIIVRARTENDPAASTITIRAGSFLMLREIA